MRCFGTTGIHSHLGMKRCCPWRCGTSQSRDWYQTCSKLRSGKQKHIAPGGIEASPELAGLPKKSYRKLTWHGHLSHLSSFMCIRNFFVIDLRKYSCSYQFMHLTYLLLLTNMNHIYIYTHTSTYTHMHTYVYVSMYVKM